MHDLALERVQALNIWIPRLVQLPNCRNQKVALNAICRIELCILSTCYLNIHFPSFLVIVPSSGLNARIEPNVLVKLIFLRDVAKVVENLFLPGIRARPIWVLFEGVGV
jgi:hypothetical protein